jgi:hypothetical protein
LVCKCWGNERQADTGYAVALWLPLAILLGAVKAFLLFMECYLIFLWALISGEKFWSGVVSLEHVDSSYMN